MLNDPVAVASSVRKMPTAPSISILLLLLTPATASSYNVSYVGTSPKLRHETGSADAGLSTWSAHVGVDRADAYLSYGPYATDAPPSTSVLVTFLLAVAAPAITSAAGVVVARLDARDAASNVTLANATVRWGDFEAADVAQSFRLMIVTPSVAAALEYRLHWEGVVGVTHIATAATSLDDAGAMGAFWRDEAHFMFSSKHVFPSPDGESGANVGFHFVATNSTNWFLFHRQYDFGPPQPAYCKADFARSVVRHSTDGGITWSNASAVAEPVNGTSYECALVDGAAFYDAAADKWLYLSQCLARDEHWRMCLFSHDGANPLDGPFTPSAANPVVDAGALWSRICAGDEKHCAPSMADEGTPEIVAVDADGFYYVTFHGWDPSHVASARGVAKTHDFLTWFVEGSNLPGDAIFSSIDCNRWNISWAKGGCVGGGEGTILASGDFMYQLIEAPDLTLGCETTPGTQNWVLGLSRAPRGAWLPTGQWQDFAVVPTVVPAIKQGVSQHVGSAQ